MVKTTVEVTGMACGMCEAHVNDAIRDAFSIKKVSSSHTKNETEIISEEELDAEKIKSVIAEQGYEVGAIKSEPYQKKGLFGFGK
jgi:copper chaperone CopZ